MTASGLAAIVAAAFNRHGKFTARVVENNLAVEIRYADTGEFATQVWIPDDIEGWVWLPDHEFRMNKPARTLPRAAGVDEVVRAVATSVLDEKPTAVALHESRARAAHTQAVLDSAAPDPEAQRALWRTHWRSEIAARRGPKEGQS